MKLKILGCPPIELSLNDCAITLGRFPRAKLDGYSVIESGVLDDFLIKEKFDRDQDRKGRSINTYHIDENLGWILFYYVSKTDFDTLSYDIRDSLYSIDIETQRPRETRQKSRILVIGFNPSVGKICILSPRGEIFSDDISLLVRWFQENFWDTSINLNEMELHDNELIDIAKDCLEKEFRVDGANLTIEDLSVSVHCREKSLLNHHLVKNTEKSLQIEKKIRDGEWNSIAIHIFSNEYSYVIYLSKSRELWDHLTIYPSFNTDRMSFFRAARFFNNILSLVSMSIISKPPEEKQASLSDFY